jgi:sulfur carrier protein
MTELLTLNKVEHPELVSVQLNGQFLDSKLYNTSVIQENDELEFLYFLGGGGRG